MSYHFDCVQTPLIISPNKRSFLQSIDIDTSSSAPSEVCLSRDISFVESRVLPDVDVANQQQEKSEADFEDIYERIDNFLDQEGLFITSPPRGGNSKGLEKAKTVTLIQCSFSAVDLGSLDKKNGPSFLARRNASSVVSRPSLSTLTISEKSV